MVYYFSFQIDRMRDKVKEKDVEVEQKQRLVTAAQMEKKRVEMELNELRDHMDIKDRKISVLQRKVIVIVVHELLVVHSHVSHDTLE